MTTSDMLRWMIRFHLSVRSSHEANAKWCQWGDFVPPERGQKGQAATYDRYQAALAAVAILAALFIERATQPRPLVGVHYTRPCILYEV
jgi:hypothetical protein